MTPASQAGHVLVRGWVLSGALLLGWLATSLLVEPRPWRTAEALAAEDVAVASRVASWSSRVTTWSIDIGGQLQSRALEQGFAVPESFLEGERRTTFAWTGDEGASVSFAMASLASARIAVRGYAADPLGLSVDVLIDGAPRSFLAFSHAWRTESTSIGPLDAGRHVLGLRPKASLPASRARGTALAIDAILVTSDESAARLERIDPARDRGVFQGSLRSGLVDRPALFVSEGILLPEADAATFVRFDDSLRSWTPSRHRDTALPALFQGWFAALWILLGPGLALLPRREIRGAELLLRVLVVSALTLIVTIAALRVLRIHVDAVTLSATGLAVVIVGAMLGLSRKIALPLGLLAWCGAALLVFSWSAIRLVPPLEDQDMEMISTAPSLTRHLTTYAPTNRGTAHFFAHPPLLHIQIAGATALRGLTDRFSYLAEPSSNLDPWNRRLSHFLAEPQLWVIRQVNVVLASLACGLLWYCLRRVGTTRVEAAMLVLLWATQPEVIVRSGYGGYFAAASLAAILLVALEASPWPAGIAGAWMSWLDQKTLLLAVAHGTARVIRPRFGALIGGALGVLGFAIYGATVSWPDFVADFVRAHGVDRVLSLGASELDTYPSRLGLWLEFVQHYGPVFFILTLWAVVRAISSERPAIRTSAWALILGAIALTLVDWRQTKHLAQFVILAPVALAATFEEAKLIERRLLWMAVVAAIIMNLVAVRALCLDFNSIAPHPSW